MRRRFCGFIAIAMIFAFAFTMTACGSGDDSNSGTISFTDDAGRKVEIPKNIKRVAPSGPLAEQVIASVAPDKMVAIAQKPKGEERQKILGKFMDLPEIGQVYGKLPFNAESLASANPDVVIDIGEAKKTVVEDMDKISKKCGKPTIFIEMNFNNADEAYKKLGKILGEEKKAEKLAKYVKRVNDELAEGMKKVGDKKLKFVYLAGKNGLGSNPKGSFHMQMMEVLGDNVFVSAEKSAKGGANEISQEELIKLNPDVIIFEPGSIYDSVKSNRAFAQMKAIRIGKYVEAPAMPYNWLGFPPSINRFMGAQWLAKLYYPNEFKFDLKDRITEYYDLFYGYKLSDKEYNNIVKNAFFK
ncbi:MAG: ABC transporter substrate-binding protein [Eubacteriales bacterium]|nr:ABC transporter substrate-binding protein [Eubacteriales bacterium]MDY3333182.1 ABC transporter substrate-binding protein [Gallibacter sp.]